MRLCLFILIAGWIVLTGCSDRHYQAESVVKHGIQNARKGNLDEAMDDFDQAIALDPQNAGAYYARGVVKSQLEDWAGAIADFTRNIGLNATNTAAYFQRGIAKQEQDDLKGALVDYTQTITFDPQFTRAYLNRGSVKSQLEDWPGARDDYTHYIKLNPGSATGYFYRGIVEQEQGDLAGALDDYNLAIEARPKQTNTFRAQIYEHRGSLKIERGDLTGAIADLDQAVALAPGHAGSYLDRGVANYLDHRAPAATVDFQKAAELQFAFPDYPHIYLWLVKAEKREQLAAANLELKDYFNAQGDRTDEWARQVGHFLTGELSPDDFLKAAGSADAKKDKEQHCEAYFYIAIKYSLAGNAAAAKSSFQQCVGTGVKHFYEYRMARMKLKQLEEKP